VNRAGSRAGRAARHAMAMLVAGLVAGFMVASQPASAQMSAGYKFLEAVKKKDGAAVEEALSEPGTTLINTRDVTTGRTALHIVTERRDITWLRFIIAKGGNVNVRDVRGITPLQIAAGMGWTEGVSELVANRARIDDPSSTGETPLIAAVHQRDIQMMRLLLKAGADPDRKDNSGRSARDYAGLDGASSPLLAEIRASAKAKSGQGGAVYGPTF